MRIEIFGYLQLSIYGGNQAKVIEVLDLVLNWRRFNAPEHLIRPLKSDCKNPDQRGERQMNDMLCSNIALVSPSSVICNSSDLDPGRPMGICRSGSHFFHLECISPCGSGWVSSDLGERRCHLCHEPIRRMGEPGRRAHEALPAGANSSGAQTELDAPTRGAADNITPQSHFRPAAQVRMLFDAAKKNEPERLKRLIDHGVNVNATDENGSTPLHIATSGGHVKCVEALIGKKADCLSDLMKLLRKSEAAALTAFPGGDPKDLIALIGKAGSFCSLVPKWYVPKLYEDWGIAGVNKRLKKTGETPLHIATRSDKVDCLKILIATGGNVNKRLKTTGETPLHIAASNGNHEHLQILSGFTPIPDGEGSVQELCDKVIGNIKNYRKLKTADLQLPLEPGCKVIKTLRKRLNTKAKIHLVQADGKMPLHLAAENGHLECLEWLLEMGAKINARVRSSTNRATPLHLAAENGHLECLKRLVELGADVNAANKNGETALHLAAYNGHVECLKQLIREGTNLNTTNNNGETALHVATKISVAEARQLWADTGRNFSEINDNGRAPEHYTIKKENGAECLKELIAKKEVIDIADNDGVTPLMIAALWGRSEHLDRLLGAGADIRIAAKCGRTALHMAAELEVGTECLNKLLAKGADINVKTCKKSITPLHIAAHNDNTETIKALLATGGIEVNEKTKNGSTALHVAAYGGCTDTVMLLLAAGVENKEKDNDGRTALHLAAYYGYSNTVKLLLAVDGIEVNKKTNNGSTALHLADYNGHSETVELLRDAGGIEVNENDNDGRDAPVRCCPWRSC
ncbi:ankyrin repeat domain-containing protein [Endozoicomonas sp. SCSIO W0465]|uniref:ankyrin repeat domain-containing protein n=1 Tax=Endozoicomonas sp. SCSIO W0465 TaxID=2918516 RepID=UPI0020756F4A|nr:ankyrin repeat domain-containing protein [Endozoicomonas sp. SCSIO W0465]USE34281.1 ankyrin repeat domain-containing protein [Endozoicomonas sp. SCSIO W0465]